MILTDAQKVVERVFYRIMMLPYGVEVSYSANCRINYVVSVNDWFGREFSFTLSKKQLLDTEKVQGMLTASFIWLESERRG